MPASPFLTAGNPRGVLQAATDALRDGSGGALAWVLETTGSTYAGVGDLALFSGGTQVGWLSGGCLEPGLARAARDSDQDHRLRWIELDTRDDAALLSGSGAGCRGRLRIALLPLRALPGADPLLAAWLGGGVDLQGELSAQGRFTLGAEGLRRHWSLLSTGESWSEPAGTWSLELPRLPRVLVFGAGPESSILLPLLRTLGWWVALNESRPRWQVAVGLADLALAEGPEDALRLARPDVALVMHHDFERDHAALEALAESAVPLIGLLGPRRRREDLYAVLTTTQGDALASRLRSPVGLDLGGRGPEAIALSIAAQLQQWRSAAAQA